VILSPTWGPMPWPLGFAPEPNARAGIRASWSRLFQNGMGLAPAKASGARHRPTLRRREAVKARG